MKLNTATKMLTRLQSAHAALDAALDVACQDPEEELVAYIREAHRLVGLAMATSSATQGVLAATRRLRRQRRYQV
jgi:hypothetical protein